MALHQTIKNFLKESDLTNGKWVTWIIPLLFLSTSWKSVSDGKGEIMGELTTGGTWHWGDRVEFDSSVNVSVPLDEAFSTPTTKQIKE